MRAKTRTTIASALTSTALAIALLTGCGSDGATSASSSMPNVEPAPSGSTSSPSSSASPSAPSSPSTSKKSTSGGSVEMAGAPGVPKKAQKHSKAGAKAFVKYYVQQINETGVKPQRGELEPLAARSCGTCDRYATSVVYMVKHDKHYSGPVFRVDGLHATAADNDKVTVAADLTQLHMRVLNADGTTFQETKREPAYFTFRLRWSDEGWRILKIFSSAGDE